MHEVQTDEGLGGFSSKEKLKSESRLTPHLVLTGCAKLRLR